MTYVVVTNYFGSRWGGEGAKAQQYCEHLVRLGVPVTVITLDLCRRDLEASCVSDWRLVEDTRFRRFIARRWRLGFLYRPHFHFVVSRILRRSFSADETFVHYLCPISPVAHRFAPGGWRFAIGPLNGNIHLPEGFESRSSRDSRRRRRLHLARQALNRLLTREKRRAKAILVSGGDSTLRSLEVAGMRPDQVARSEDAGIPPAFFAHPRFAHRGANARFYCLSRHVSYKGVDLAIRAFAKLDPRFELDVYGEGAMTGEWRDLAARLGLEHRVRFKGWLSHDRLHEALRDYRGYIFPTLAEANGISMQEAMAAGIPVIATRWGGPSRLADDSCALLIDPRDEAFMVDAIAGAAQRLADDPELAEALSIAAREVAERRFGWDVVARSWLRAVGYPAPETGAADASSSATLASS